MSETEKALQQALRESIPERSEMFGFVVISQYDARLIDRAFLPVNLRKCRTAHPDVIAAAQRFKVATDMAGQGSLTKELADVLEEIWRRLPRWRVGNVQPGPKGRDSDMERLASQIEFALRAAGRLP